MIFWSIVFFTTSFYSLIKGGMFRKSLIKLKKIEIEKIETGDDKKYILESLKTGCFAIVALLTLVVARIFFLINAIGYDVYKYPTIAAILLIILRFVKTKKTKKIEEMTADELIIHKAELLKPTKRTFKQFLRSLLWTVYFGYMFYVLVFLNT